MTEMMMSSPDFAKILAMAQEASKITPARWAELMEIMKVDADMNRLMKSQWFSKPRDSEEAVREYYRTSDIWFVNTFTHGHAALVLMATEAKVDALPPDHVFHPLTNDFQLSGWILDYGGGFWNDTWVLAAKGYRVVQAEVKGPVTKLMKMFIEEYGFHLSLDVVEVETDNPLQAMYDGIVCFETLEHLKEPAFFMGHLAKHLHSGQPFVYSASFGAPEHAPYHVAENAHLSNQTLWGDVMRSAGLLPHWKAKDGHRQIWKRRMA